MRWAAKNETKSNGCGGILFVLFSIIKGIYKDVGRSDFSVAYLDNLVVSQLCSGSKWTKLVDVFLHFYQIYKFLTVKTYRKDFLFNVIRWSYLN